MSVVVPKKKKPEEPNGKEKNAAAHIHEKASL